MISRLFVLGLFSLLGISESRFGGFIPQFYAQDSAIIVDTNQPPPPSLRPIIPQSATLPYYQPVQELPAYKIITKGKIQQNPSTSTNFNSASNPPTTIFTQEEFPRDLLEIAQKKLGLKSLEEVPSITELAELLGTNSASETISYIRQLTSTEQGIALMKAYIESSDYTDSVGSNKENEILESKKVDIKNEPTSEEGLTTNSTTKTGFWERMVGFLNIYGSQPQQEQVTEQTVDNYKNTRVNSLPSPTSNVYKNLRPIYMRSPLPYHYPVPLRPMPFNRVLNATNTKQNYQQHNFNTSPLQPAQQTHSHLNTPKALNPTYIQQLARIANVSPKKLEHFLQSKPKLAELAAKLANYPLSHNRSTVADRQLLAAIQKAIEQDEDLKKVLTSTDTLK